MTSIMNLPSLTRLVSFGVEPTEGEWAAAKISLQDRQTIGGRWSQASLSSSKWDKAGVQHRGSCITYVFRRTPGARRFEPWTVVAPSAIMGRLGKNGLGLYAARSFHRDEYVGRYPTHDVVGHFQTRAEALSAPETRALLMRGRDKLIALRLGGRGFTLVDGEGGGPPHVELCNDPRNTALKPNADLTDAGWLRVLHARVPPFDLGKTIEQNAYSELRVAYGDEYWALHDVLDTRACPLEVDD